MTEPFVRPDVRGFLDYLASMPGPKMHELEPAGGARDVRDDEGRRRPADRRARHDARPQDSGTGGRYPRAPVRSARQPRAGSGGGVLPWRRVRDRRSRQPCQLHRGDGARARFAGDRGRLPPGARSEMARRARRLRSGGALGGGQPGRAGPRGHLDHPRRRQRGRQSDHRHRRWRCATSPPRCR